MKSPRAVSRSSEIGSKLSKVSGMSKWALLLIIIALVVFGVSALKLGPHYIDYGVMQGILERLPADTHKMSRSDIREHFSKQFRIENFGFKVREILTVDRSRDQTNVIVQYEVREHMFYNVDVVLSFEDSRTFN